LTLLFLFYIIATELQINSGNIQIQCIDKVQGRFLY